MAPRRSALNAVRECFEPFLAFGPLANHRSRRTYDPPDRREEPPFSFLEAHRAIKGVGARTMIAGRDLDASTAEVRQGDHSVPDKRLPDPKATSVAMNYQRGNPPKQDGRVKQGEAMNADTADDTLARDSDESVVVAGILKLS